MDYKITLNSNEVPKKWYNINADLPVELPMPKNSEGNDQISSLQKAFTKVGLEQEFSTERFIKIPKDVRKLYMQMGRPSPLFRATKLEEYLDTPAKIYYKREDTSPTGSHKLNSAIPQAYFAKKEGIERLTTETGAGQWGTALSLACNLLDLECTVYMVKVSFQQKPDRKSIMNIYNGNVFASPSENTKVGREILAQNPNHPGSLGVAISEAMEEALENEKVKYTLGSVLNHVMLHQTIIGQELKKQLEIAGEEPDIMIACAGGGSNFAGSLFPFIKDKIADKSDTQFIAVEPSACPTLTKGSYEYDFGDVNGFTPMLKMFTLGHDFVAPSVHAGGLRYHGMSPQVSLLTKEGYIEPRSAHQRDVFEAGITFARNEGVLPAPETTHAIKVAIDEALKCKQTGEEKTIVMNFSGHGMLDLKGYASYFEGSMPNSK
ncbi:tryptophan synthase beta chain [Methanobrevibacter gottschalkii]|uniref:Tryptophan synthase beta chain n=2 Tax=Methanobrevibacter gottschalkii TaxID=190974 RepID=A0A3N5B657_9EURY|nr:MULTISPECIES: TrpB-like pyridoxal phosphate-dependent enzyme [Methanobrevibacter]MCQ2970643.1 TrpB-like pyridoxal phosphate-dependent enzyme [archaeon]OEC93725.1 TrpB-like pyridoxal-phosphate dependent enzyme [Methanobrevibacter sp. A27]RPF52833.1 tryptophan synthase beta chain [Methanobrevibacter gottschalkii DSM 11977]SEK19926.1 tryptophan synthase beta chain [Methanobrevibacter gottschalkii]